MTKLLRFLRNEKRGAALTEYAVVVGLIAIVAITAVTAFQGALSAAFQNLAAQISVVK
jgi:Flp pilus assembly pilin Flp